MSSKHTYLEHTYLEQIALEQAYLEQLSSGTVQGYRPAEYGLEWGAYGVSPAKQASNKAGQSSSIFDFRPAPSTGTRPGPDLDISCLDVGVMFDVCLPKDQAGPQNLGPQNLGPQNLGPQNSGPQNSGPQNSGPHNGGGDFADVVPLHGDWVALFLGDAIGQGAAAALAVPQALYCLRQTLSGTMRASGTPLSGCPQDPAHTLKRVNRHLCGPALPAACASVSLTLAVLNTNTGEARCACAGSEPPLILRSNGQIETISAGRTALGVEIGREYRSVDFRLGTGDALLLATDGITKARKADGGERRTSLRYEGLTELALEAFGLGGSPGWMAKTVLNGARAFAGGSFHDHASVLVASRR